MNTRTIEVTVRINVQEDTDIAELISEMDYDFVHPKIVDTEITDVNTEL